MTLEGTMLSKIEHWGTTKGSADALHDLNDDGTWDSTTWSEVWSNARRVGKGLMSLGLEPGDCVGIVGKNRPDWLLCQHGINAAQGIPAPMYTTLLTDQVAYIIDNAQAKIVICD
ncbi:MAG: AMP-binding protein [Deltaproteobacteria bacterium]|nr:AMP-binding protein [Deltaproteobacteria bacterium]